MNFIGNNQRPVITIIVRVDNIISIGIPVGDPEYLCRTTNEPLYDVSIVCTGIQGLKEELIQVTLTFSLGLTENEQNKLKGVYQKKKLLKVKGEYYISKTINKFECLVEIDHPIAYPLPTALIKLHEEIMGETYLPQWTLESEYQ